MKDRLGDMLLSTITRETIEGCQAKRELDGVSNRTVNMDVGALREGSEALRPLEALQDHVTMSSEAGARQSPSAHARAAEAYARLPGRFDGSIGGQQI